MTEATITKPANKQPRKMAREPQPQGAAHATGTAAIGTEAITPSAVTKAPSKTSLVLDLLRRPEGASIEELVAATGWLPHTTRAALTGLKKKGHVLTSEKVEDVRRYRVTGAPT
ncbi:MAG: DUF3489 domain-containing protein [Novosphingobium sp.]